MKYELIYLILIPYYVVSLHGHSFIEKNTEWKECKLKCNASRIPHSRIVGGEPTHIKRYPFIVSIQYKRVLARHICGGSILSSYWILTAAHCVCKPGTTFLQHPSKYVVLARLTNCRSIIYWRAAREVQAIYKHPLYNRRRLYNDIALMKLKRGIRLCEFSMIIRLASRKKMYRISKNERQSCTAIGWGATKEGGNTSSILRVVELPLLTQYECERIYPIEITQICTLYAPGGKDACEGDSGGPLVCNGEQVGITSLGWGCARKGVPGIWTRVDKFEKWINQVQFKSDASFICNKIYITVFVTLLIIYYISV